MKLLKRKFYVCIMLIGFTLQTAIHAEMNAAKAVSAMGITLWGAAGYLMGQIAFDIRPHWTRKLQKKFSLKNKPLMHFFHASGTLVGAYCGYKLPKLIVILLTTHSEEAPLPPKKASSREQKETAYQTLGLDQQATTQDIRQAYRRMALRYHPDKNKAPDAAERFRAMKEAYEILT